MPDEKENIIAAIRVKDQDISLMRCLNQLKSLCGGCVIVDEGSSNPKTQEVIENPRFKGFIKSYERSSPDQGIQENEALSKLLGLAQKHGPEWIILLDADEIFEDRMKTEILKLIHPQDASVQGYFFKIFHLFQSEGRYRVDGDYGKKYGVKLFRNSGKFSGATKFLDGLYVISAWPKEIDDKHILRSDIRVKDYSLIDAHISDIGDARDLDLRFWEEEIKAKTLSLCLIVKNEENELNRCLDSVKGLYDELIVVWSGDNASTKKILDEHSAKIIKYEWINDYAHARNAGIKEASCDWIMWLDADEYLDSADIPRLKEIIRTADSSGITMVTKCLTMLGDVYAVFSRTRIFRNRLNLRFAGHIHEDIPSIKHHGLTWTDINVWNIRDSENEKERKRKNETRLESIKKTIRQDINAAPIYYFYAGRDLKNCGRFEEAAPYFESFLKKASRNHLQKASALTLLSACYLGMLQPVKSLETACASLAVDNLLAEPYLVIASAYKHLNKTDNAVFALECAINLECPKASQTETYMKNYTTEPRYLLAEIYFNKGDKEKAEIYLGEVLKMNPAHKRAGELLKKIREEA